jgi:hypothetical protein
MMTILYQEPDNGFLGLSYNEELDVFVMHVDLVVWSVSHYKRYLKIFSAVLRKLRLSGITEVYSFCDSEKDVKFNQMFGFVSTGHLGYDDKGVESLILKLEV